MDARIPAPTHKNGRKARPTWHGLCFLLKELLDKRDDHRNRNNDLDASAVYNKDDCHSTSPLCNGPDLEGFP
jgi:hypothetical protein